MKETGPVYNQPFLQQLADLGFPKDIRSTLTSEEIEKIIASNTTFVSFQNAKQKAQETETRQAQAAQVPEDLKNEYKTAYETFVAREAEFNDFGLPSEIERFHAIIKICGSGSIEEIETYMHQHAIELSDEETTFLQKTIDYRRALEVKV